MINSEAAVENCAATSEESSWWFPCHRKSAGLARGLLRTYLADLGIAEAVVAVGELVISELVTNAVLHARVPGRLIHVRLEVVAGRLRIEVHDASSERPVLGPWRDGDDESGRGLWLVATLSEAWGCCPRPGGIGKFIWALVGAEGGDQ